MLDNPSGNYCLARNIDASSIANFVPIGTGAAPFRGKFFGNNRTISNLTINSAANFVGLFGLTVSGSVIQDVRLVNVRVLGTADNSGTGAIAGLSEGTTISGVHVVSGRTNCTGGNCAAGGIIGSVSNGTVLSDSSNAAVVSATVVAAGAAGFGASNAVVRRTYSTGRVTCTASPCQAGGLVGRYASASVAQSYATGPVSGGDGSRVGGLAGLLEGTATVAQSYAIGAVRGGASAFVGGLVGQHNGNDLTESYAAGPVSGGTGASVGGLAANASDFSPIVNSYWDTATTGQATSDGGTGMTTEQLQADLPVGFGNAWAITRTRSYPFLNLFEVDLASPLATLVLTNRVFFFAPISQLDDSQYATAPENGDRASLAAAFAMIGRAIGTTKNIASLRNVKIDTYWNDDTQTTTFTGAIANHATLSATAAIPANVPLRFDNVLKPLKQRKLVLLRGTFFNGTSTVTHWMLATLYTADADDRAQTVVAHDPWTGAQVMIDPSTKRVISPQNFPLADFRVNGFRKVTLNQ